MTRFRRVFLVLGVVVGVVALAGCKVNARVDVALRDDGSGTLGTTITFDSDAVQRLGGAAEIAKNVPLDDLRKAGWRITPFARGTGGTESVSLAHDFTGQSDLARRIVDLAGPHGILQSPTVSHERGWFSSHDAFGIVVDVRSPSVDIVSDAPLAARLRAAGQDPATLEAILAVQLKSALHVSVSVHLPGGHTQTYDAAQGSVKTLRVSSGGTNWDKVVKFGIGLALALLAGLFFLAATVGARRNRRRAAQRVGRDEQLDRVPLM